MTKPSELSTLGRMIANRFPIVVVLCSSPEANWYGKYHLNIQTDHPLCGPYDSEQEACDAIDATGEYVRRTGRPEYAKTPHYDWKG